MADDPLCEGLDLAHLARQTFGDEELARELLRLFEDQCDRLLPVLLAEAAGRAIRAEAAHTLKGAARAVGAWRIAAGADALERALEGGRGEAEAADLDAAVRLARPALQRCRAGTASLSPTGDTCFMQPP